MLRKVLVLIGVAVTAAALASPLNYAQRNVAVRAGVVLLASQQLAPGIKTNYTPYVWFNLDSNRNVKPAGWTFYNPKGATRVTDAIAQRWTAHNAALGYPGGPAVNSHITKRDAAYWEVDLASASDAHITSYDILVVSAYGAVNLNPLEREKLRKFMEAGGVLWVDVRSGVNLDVINGFPLPFNVGNTGGFPVDYDYGHPLMTTPHTIGLDSLNLMQSEVVLGLRPVDLAALGFPDLQPLQSPTEGDWAKLLPVAQDNLGPAVMVGQVGDGYLVVTSRGVAAALNYNDLDTAPVPGRNAAHRAYNPVFYRGSDAAGKIASNMAHLTAGHAQNGKGAHKTTSSPIDGGAPLLKRFDAPLTLSPGAGNYVPPVIFQGLVIVSDGSRIYAYDANPSVDLNGDGNPDDGISDYGRGANLDLVWSSVALGSIGGPVAAEIPYASGAPVHQIAVADSLSNVYLFNAFPAAPGTNMAPAVGPISPPPGTSAAVGPPNTPTYHDGLLFVADDATAGLGGVVGRVWIIDARLGVRMQTAGVQPWVAGGSSSLTMNQPSAGPTIGYIPIADNSGGVDRVVYVPFRSNSLQGTTAGFSSYWLGAKGEKPTGFAPAPGTLTVTTRAAGQGLGVFNAGNAHPLGVKLTVLDANGNPLNAAAMDTLFNGSVLGHSSGNLTFGLKAGANLALIQGVRIDYTIDWGTNGVPDPNKTNQLLRGRLFLPDDIRRDRRILHNLALSPQGTLSLVHSAGGISGDANSRYGGTLYSFFEEGRGNFKCVNRYDLYPQHTMTLSGTTSTIVPETLTDNDQLINFAPAFLGGRFTNLTFMGGPSILNGVVYVTARGMKSGFVPCTILMAFQADPDVAKIEVGDVAPGFTIVQPDMARSDIKTTPNQFNILQGNQYVYEREGGGDRGTIRLDNLMSNTREAVQNAISRSQPIILRRSGQPDLVLEPDRTGSRWSPMLWYSVYHGMANDSPPMSTGKTVFLAGASSLPNILKNGSFTPTGLLTAQDAEISPTDAFLISDATRPWLNQLWHIKFVSMADVRPNPDIRWPQFVGATSFQTWRTRLYQTTLGASQNAYGVVAGDNVLFSWSEQGLWGYNRADIMVADEGRLARFDSSGNPIWASDATIGTGISADVGSAGTAKWLIRPTRAYAVGSQQMVVVDPGADRVIRVDSSGHELRSIEGFRLDPNFTPDGYETNEPLKLKAPRDVITFNSYETAIPFSNPSPTGVELWVHHVIADSGHKRLIEVVDRYRANAATRRNEGAITDASGQPALGILLWHSPSSFSGKNFSYTSVARVYIDDPIVPANSRWVYAAGIGSALPTKVDTGLDTPGGIKPREEQSGNGGIVVFDGANSQVVNEVTVPAIPANVLYNPATGNFDAPGQPQRQKLLGNLNSVTMRNVLINGGADARVAIMFADAEGVFEIIQNSAGGPWVVNWMLPKIAYTHMRGGGLDPLDFRANYARRLDSGEVLIVNGYTGKLGNGAAFNGEVLQVDGDPDPNNDNNEPGYSLNKINLGFRNFSVRFELPPVQGTRGLVIPVFADRR